MRRARQPLARRPDDVMPIGVLQSEDQPASGIAIEHRGTPAAPGPRDLHALVADLPLVGLSGQGHAAQVAAEPLDKWCIAPARAAKAEIAFDHGAAAHAARRVKQLECRLKFQSAFPIFRHMSDAPLLTDRSALARNRARAGDEPFLHDIAADEVKDRLMMVNKEFSEPKIVSGHRKFWARSLAPDWGVVPDEVMLDLTPGAHDLIVHAMALHWANDPVGQMIQCRNALRPDGLFMAVFLGGKTLTELRQALAQAEGEVMGGLSPRVAPMAEIRDAGALLQRAGFSMPVADRLELTASYTTPFALMSELRHMGEGNALATRHRAPVPRRLFTRMAEIYAERYGTDDGRITATFELIFLSGWAPDTSQPQPLRPGSAQARLADALGSTEFPLKD